MGQPPTLETIRQAERRLLPYIHRTPVLTCSATNDRVGARLFFKCENFQKTGAFKIRGASNAVLSLDPAQAEGGVVTHSSGNHGAALSLAAQNRGVSASIVMPSNTSAVKQAAVRTYGGKITFCRPTLQDREETAREIELQTGATLIHPYNDFRMIEGHGTAVLELLEEIPDLDMVMVPTGGGGLLSGTLIAAKGLRKDLQVIGVEPSQADDAYRSWKAGELVPLETANTIADGLRTSLGDKTFPIIRELVDGMALATEKGILEAMCLVMERMKIVIEPSAAVPLAALLENQVDVSGRRVGIILSGGNLDLGALSAWM